ncbi:putative leucine-rich repeat protein, induced by the SPI-2 [Trichinella spiralis]|uniref:putative leucine-rich repeat protein, induced by the SPI-2 n=1 Tax=Trichinella spiralis TaxID=6334 RepID=UPI0001EFB737|nr:putative leucine-rich repeat protein, induced by the SPI-2 [Trichinella spiralis]
MDWTGWSAWKIGAIATAGAAALLLVAALFLCRKRRGVQPKADSIYSVPDRWDSLSLHYIDNPTEFLKGSWEELSDDSYLACLEKEIAKRLNCVHAYQNPVVNSCELRLDHYAHQCLHHHIQITFNKFYESLAQLTNIHTLDHHIFSIKTSQIIMPISNALFLKIIDDNRCQLTNPYFTVRLISKTANLSAGSNYINCYYCYCLYIADDDDASTTMSC